MYTVAKVCCLQPQVGCVPEWRVSHSPGEHKTCPGTSSDTTANTSHVYSTTSAINSSENNVIKTSCAGSGWNPVGRGLWGEHTSHFPSPGTDFPLFASIHAESFQKGAAVATLSADVFSVGSHSAVTCPKGEHEEYIEMRPSCRLAQAFHTNTDSEWYKTNLSWTYN